MNYNPEEYNKLYQHQVDNINIAGRDLTDWELEFMESITAQIKDGKMLDGLILSQKQAEIVNRIYGKRT